MKKAELVQHLSENSENMTVSEASKVIDLVFEKIAEALMSGDSYTHDNFGSFKVVERAPRKGRNPQTGETIDIPAKLAVKFTPSDFLKKGVNK